jgi:hypothetical protein
MKNIIIKVEAISRMPSAWKPGVNHRIVGVVSRKQNKMDSTDIMIEKAERRGMEARN